MLLSDEERRVVHAIPDLTRAQAVVREIASGERVYGLLYLADVVKSAATHEREAFIDSFLRQGDP